MNNNTLNLFYKKTDCLKNEPICLDNLNFKFIRIFYIKKM